MKNKHLTLSTRIRLVLLSGIARLLAWAIAPALKPAMASAERRTPHGGRIIDGEFRRLDAKHNDRW